MISGIVTTGVHTNRNGMSRPLRYWNASRRYRYVPPAPGIAAPSSAQTSPSASARSAPRIHPKTACGPPSVAIISGIVTNGPIPHICVMLSAIAERRPRLRSKPSSPRAPGSARCSRAKRASRISVIWTSCTAAPAGRTARGCARRGAPSHPHGPLTERAVGAQLREHRAVVAERASALQRLRGRQPRRLELLALGGERPELLGEVGEAEVVGRLLGHRLVQPRLVLAEALERALEAGELLACLPECAAPAGGPGRRGARRSRSRRRSVARGVRL